MNDFDDILEQPAEQESPAQEKPQRKLEWWQIKEQRQRKEAYSTLDRIFHEFSEGKGDVQGYLDTHGRFDRYSARNALLIHDKCPGATQLGNYKYWENLDAEILKTEKNNPIIILEPGNTYRRKDGSTGQNYYAKEVYDISQTTAQGQEQPKVALDERLLLKALIYKSPAAIHVVEQLPDGRRGALYQPEQNSIFVEKGMDAADIFRCVSQELAKAQLMMVNPEQTPAECGNKAFCVSYMLCKNMGLIPVTATIAASWAAFLPGKRLTLSRRLCAIWKMRWTRSIPVWPRCCIRERTKAGAAAPTMNGKECVKWKDRKKSF